MEFLYATLSGISAKLYDDLTDNNLLTDKTTKEVLKGSQWILLTLISQTDFNFALPFYLTAFANSFSDTEAFVSPYEKSLLILYPFLLLISAHTAKLFTSGDILFATLTTLALLTEPFINNEEYSYRKLGTRFVAFLWTLIMIRFFNFSPSVLKAIYFFLGYSFISCCFQYYMTSLNPETSKPLLHSVLYGPQTKEKDISISFKEYIDFYTNQIPAIFQTLSNRVESYFVSSTSLLS
uniref:Uncharacterized protein n=1 Tax=viral metagenome TaxID=1070528 RepID=A0A6C0KND8_9ZZZZ